MLSAIRFRNIGRPHINFYATLDRKRFLFNLSYNYRDKYWYMSISDNDGYVVTGIRIIVGWPLLKNYVDERLPKQRLMLISLIGQEERPTFSNFGKKFILVYGDE